MCKYKSLEYWSLESIEYRFIFHFNNGRNCCLGSSVVVEDKRLAIFYLTSCIPYF